MPPRHLLLLSFAVLLPSCNTPSSLLPSWQQDTTLIYNGQAAALAQHESVPHTVCRACYSSPAHVGQLIARQGDSPSPVRQLAIMGDGTFALGFSDAATGQWLDVQECGGHLFVSGLPRQAYRIHVKNLTPMPLDLAVGIDGKDLASGRTASWTRSSLRLGAKQSLVLDRHPRTHRPLLFRAVHGDHALFETHPEGVLGLIQIAAWLAADAPSLPGQKIRPSQYAPGALIPLDKPQQYR